MKCQFNDLFKDDFGELEYSVMERTWYRVKEVPIVGDLGKVCLDSYRGMRRALSSRPGRTNMKSVAREKGPVRLKHPAVLNLKAGDVVRVRSREEIRETLDEKSQFQGVEFMETMWEFCGQTHKVLKRIEKILDPWENRLRKSRDMVILEGLFCHGDPLHALECDRTCLYYWKEAWLEKVGETEGRG
jgi:hypothetical protein